MPSASHWSLATVRSLFGAWRSLVARLVRDQEVPSSNLGAPTTYLMSFHWVHRRP